LFKIQHIQDQERDVNYIELKNTSQHSSAKIDLNLGGSLQELSLKNKTIIRDLEDLNYNTSFASAILFPFTCRLKNGTYEYKKKQYQLDPNFKNENSVIHGLVYNKTFKYIKESISKNAASVTIEYRATEKNKGYPFRYSIQLTYTLTSEEINLEAFIKNNDTTPLPFNIGWHPYFWSSDLHNSYLALESDKKLRFDQNMIPVKVEDFTFPVDFQIKDQTLDDCFILNNKTVKFKTPDYCIMMKTTSLENYFQVFTPPKGNAIALEFLTGPANSFNNKLGLRELNAKESYSVNWDIKLTDDE